MGSITMTDDKIDEMIAEQKKRDPRLRNGAVKITPYAVRCLRHGRRVLSASEVSFQPYGWFGTVDLLKEYECPECGSCLTLDRFWYVHTKGRLSNV